MLHKVIANVIPWFPKPFIWQFSKKYVAGESLQSAIDVSKGLNAKGMMVTIDLLGECIKNLDEAEENANAYFDIIDHLMLNNINGSVSLKPTFFGLNINAEKCYLLVKRVVEYAHSKACIVRIDMEDSNCTSLEIALFRRLKEEFPQTVGLVFQAYLKRTISDVEHLQDLQTTENRLNFRLCKGIYVEPEKIAYKDLQKIRENYLAVLEQMITFGNYVAIATHDRFLVEGAYKLIERYKLSKSDYEFQMLYGVTPNLRDEIVEKGHKMRIYIPYGKDWFGYCTRRLKENPKMTTDIIKGIFVKG